MDHLMEDRFNRNLEEMERDNSSELTALLKEYFSYKSLDGNPKRQELRVKIKELLDKIEKKD